MRRHGLRSTLQNLVQGGHQFRPTWSWIEHVCWKCAEGYGHAGGEVVSADDGEPARAEPVFVRGAGLVEMTAGLRGSERSFGADGAVRAAQLLEVVVGETLEVGIG